MGKTTDQYCVRRQKMINKESLLTYQISYFLELKELRNLKIFTKNSKITPDLKESHSFFFTSRKMRSIVAEPAVYIISGVWHWSRLVIFFLKVVNSWVLNWFFPALVYFSFVELLL